MKNPLELETKGHRQQVKLSRSFNCVTDLMNAELYTEHLTHLGAALLVSTCVHVDLNGRLRKLDRCDNTQHSEQCSRLQREESWRNNTG